LIGLLMRLFSYVYHLVLCLFLLGLGIVGWMSRSATFSAPWLAWEGDHITLLLGAGAIGILSVILAVSGKFRPLFVLWTLAVVVMMFRGFFSGPYVYEGMDEFKTTLWMFAGAIMAFLATLTGPRKSRS
jgi:hypothetical protein